MPRSLSVFALSVVLLGGAACTSGRAYFRPTQTRAMRANGTPVPTRYMVPLDAGAKGLLLHTEARAFQDELAEDAAFPTLQVRLWVHNDTNTRLELRLAEFTATDNHGQRFRFSRGRYKGASTGVVLIGPRTRGYMDIYFNLPNDYQVLDPQGMTLDWSLRIGDQEFRQSTTFKRASDRAFHDPFLSVPMSNL